MSETKEERKKRQTDENFALIGRYVQAFEQMVDTVRNGCVMFLSPTAFHERFAKVVLNHQVMTAWPLFGILRSLIWEGLKANPNLSEEIQHKMNAERETMRSILKQIDAEYQDALKFRNDILHSTWRIGWTPNLEFDDFSMIEVEKLKATNEGLKILRVVQNKKEIEEQILICEGLLEMIRVAYLVTLLYHSAIYRSKDTPTVTPSNYFAKLNKRWIIAVHNQPNKDH